MKRQKRRIFLPTAMLIFLLCGCGADPSAAVPTEGTVPESTVENPGETAGETSIPAEETETTVPEPQIVTLTITAAGDGLRGNLPGDV